MLQISFQGRNYHYNSGDGNLLEFLLKQNVNINFSCKKGVCHTCMLQELNGNVTAESQTGLGRDLRKNGYFLPCRCFPVSNMDIALPPERNSAFLPGKESYPLDADDITQHVQAVYPEPDEDLWEELEEGKLLGKILDDFYDAVYQDEKLSPFFVNSTKKRSKEKVYSFYRRIFSGEEVFFGDRP